MDIQFCYSAFNRELSSQNNKAELSSVVEQMFNGSKVSIFGVGVQVKKCDPDRMTRIQSALKEVTSKQIKAYLVGQAFERSSKYEYVNAAINNGQFSCTEMALHKMENDFYQVLGYQFPKTASLAHISDSVMNVQTET